MLFTTRCWRFPILVAILLSTKSIECIETETDYGTVQHSCVDNSASVGCLDTLCVVLVSKCLT